MATTSDVEPRSITRRLSVLDRYLTVWILLTMGAGIALGYAFPERVEAVNDTLTVGHTNLCWPPGWC